jgi:hypothetical protein
MGSYYDGPLARGPEKMVFSPQRWQLWKKRLVEYLEIIMSLMKTEKVRLDNSYQDGEVEEIFSE